MVDPVRAGALGRIPQAEDLVAEEEEGVVVAFADDVQAELLDEEAAGLGPVADPKVHVVEAEDLDVRNGWGHARCSVPRGRQGRPPISFLASRTPLE